ncbi:hypothetical protein Nepgr_004115 [Nepenthes gracilis]|uniref:Uncharacterized protein n=1 Tax=Nepenthes gracilis TaxID=150966 RepID=A0AAD3S0V9_NEPGR|nr:hypothetical protein Nepgr_004115 [Nepenthes gracilis]
MVATFSRDRNDYPCSMGLHPSLNVVGYCSLPRHSCNRHLLPFSESSAGPPTTSLRPERFIAQAGTQAPEEGSPTNVRCKAPHLIKIILAYSPKKKRADPIEDESEVKQGHFCPPPFSRSRDSSKRLAAFVHFSDSEDFLSAGGIRSPIWACFRPLGDIDSIPSLFETSVGLRLPTATLKSMSALRTSYSDALYYIKPPPPRRFTVLCEEGILAKPILGISG